MLPDSTSSDSIELHDPLDRTPRWSHFTGSGIWALAVAILGVSVWVQLFWIGLETELSFADPRPIALLAYLIPLGVLVAGIWSRGAILLLALFTIGCLPGVMLLPPAERAMMTQGGALIRIGLGLALYLAMASAGSGGRRGTKGRARPSRRGSWGGCMDITTLRARSNRRARSSLRIACVGSV